MPTYTIREDAPEDQKPFQPYGAAVDFWRCKHNEIMLSGAAETGKTRAALEKLDALCWKYPQCQAVIVRKIRGTIAGTVLQTYMRKVLKGDAVKGYGGQNPEWFDYPNGSRIWIAGIDDPGKALSSERDIIYVNQSEELRIEDWETLLTRATGRAGNMPYSQVMGDCNPDHPKHWIKMREAKGHLKLFESRHEDNPTLYDRKTEQWTAQGVKTIGILDGLTGVRYWRLRRGQWRAAEGVVYEDYDVTIHRIKSFDASNMRIIRSIDFGYTNPFVCQWWALDNEGRMFRYRELYGTKRLVSEWAVQINALSEGEKIEATISDHDAEDRATLDKCGIMTIPARKDITSGIQAVQERFKHKRLFLVENALVSRDALLEETRKPGCTDEEIDSYVWPKSQDGRPIKEVPVKDHDHGMDAMRYAVAYIDRVGQEKYLDFSVNNAIVKPVEKSQEPPKDPSEAQRHDKDQFSRLVANDRIWS